MSRNNIMVGAIQETKLTSTCSLHSCDGYNVLRKDRTRNGGGGLAFLIHHSVQYRPISPELDSRDPYMECMGVAVRSGAAEIELYNVYIPPVASCAPRYLPETSGLLQGNNRVVLGDFNAHHELWHSPLGNDHRGIALAEQIDNSTFCTVNEDAPTRIMGDCYSSPDITIVSAGLINDVTWQPVISLGSDHLPIILSIDRPSDFITSERRTFVNHRKADWQGFREFTDGRFSDLPIPSNVQVAEKIFRQIINAAAARYIPAGRIPEIRPNFPAEAAAMADQRDDIRRTNPGDPRISQLNSGINRLVGEYKRNKWLDHLKQCNLSSGIGKLWTTVKSLSNPTKRDDRTAVTFGDRVTSDPKRCAGYFNRQFIEHPVSDKAKRRVLRKVRALRADDAPPQFTVGEVADVIHSAKPSKALGPDGISTLMLKHLGIPGVEYLTRILNLSLTTLIIPDAWKMGRVVPLLKPGKEPSKGESYRPISLLSPVAKTLEALLLPSLIGHFPSANHQHGFRKQHSTTTALHAITTHISRGLNQNRPCDRTILVALDLSKAFDTVNHATLFEDINNTSLPPSLKRWVINYMCGRQSYVEFRNAKSRARRVKQGVPQGGVISPALFNLYLSGIPRPPDGVEIVSYADDCTILASGPNIDDICQRLNVYLIDLANFFTARNLSISVAKSSATLFTTWTAEMRMPLNVRVDDMPIPTTNYPKVLGVTFDSMFKSSAHATAICDKLRSRNKVLKSLAGSTWGSDKETLLTTYKAIGRSVANYAAPVWSANISDTQWRNIQTCQNAALRTATGCLLMSSESHLHEEAKIISVREHNFMLSKQYLFGCYRRDHPNHHMMDRHPPPRQVRRDLHDLEREVQRYKREPLDQQAYAAGLNDIHSDAVTAAIDNHRVNIVLGEHPPPIASEEEQLPRQTRVILAQLRSGWCCRLNSYRARIDQNVPNICPACQQGPHDTTHLFNCPEVPTQLVPRSLWTNPVQVAAFLDLDT